MHVVNRWAILGSALGLLSLSMASVADEHVPVATERGPTGQASVGVTVRDGVGPTGMSLSGQSGNIGGRVEAHTDGSVGISGGVRGSDGTSAHAGVQTDARGNTSVQGGVTVPFK